MYTLDTNEKFGLVFSAPKARININIGYYKVYLSPYFNFSFYSSNNVKFNYLIDVDVVNFLNSHYRIKYKKSNENNIMDSDDYDFDEEAQKKILSLDENQLVNLFNFATISAMINLNPDEHLEQQCHYVVLSYNLFHLNNNYSKKIKDYLNMLQENEISSIIIENIKDTFQYMDVY